jgi:polysaccharide export outer membrane protein
MDISPFNRLILLILIACTPLPVWAQTTTIEKTSAPASPNSNLKPLVNLNGGTQSLSVSESQDTFRYTLGAGDNIKIEVFNVPELSGNQTIAPDGTINISLIGAVKLEGLGLDEANALLREKLNPFLVRNIVNISLIYIFTLYLLTYLHLFILAHFYI